MKSRIKKIFRKSFLQHVIIMVTGTAAAQLVGLILQPVITRIYGPEAYGMMGAFLAIAGLFLPISTFTYAIAIILPKSDVEAKSIVQISLYITVGLATLVGLIIIFFNDAINAIFNLDSMYVFLYLIPITILFSGVMQITEQWIIRKKEFFINAKIKFIHALIFNGAQVGIGLFSPTGSTLIVISSLREGIKASLMIVLYKGFKFKSSYRNGWFKSWRHLKGTFKKYKDFPIYRAPQVFLYSISQSLPILILTAIFGAASAGYFTLGRTVLIAPTSLIAKSVSDVFYPRIAEAHNNNENITGLLRKAIVSLCAIGIVPFGVIIIFGPDLFEVVFGKDWSGAGEYARWMAIGVFFEFVNKPCLNSLAIFGAQKFHLRYTIVELFFRIGLLLIGYLFWENDVVAVALFSISGAILNIGLMIITLRLSQQHDKFGEV